MIPHPLIEELEKLPIDQALVEMLARTEFGRTVTSEELASNADLRESLAKVVPLWKHLVTLYVAIGCLFSSGKLSSTPTRDIFQSVHDTEKRVHHELQAIVDTHRARRN